MEHCAHKWVKGPYYLHVAVTYEEPQFYPPQGQIQIQHCVLCGLLRLPEKARKEVGENLGPPIR